MSNTKDWLQELGLSEYQDIFEKNDLDWESIPGLEDADLKEIGIRSLGHRKKLLRAIALLTVQTSDLAVAAPATGSPLSATSESERRQVTVMFCDLVGSTALSTRLDAEDMDAVIRKYQDKVTPVVREFGGHIARFSGDGILSYFGYPKALEHEPERAIRSAIKAASVISKASLHPGVKSQVRIGIATGDVVVGGLFEEGKLYEAMATGETPNLAARLQGIAEPGAIVVCETTRKLADNMFTYDNAGEQNLRGFRDGVQAWVVTGSVESDNRFQAKHAREEWTQLRGRQREFTLLKASWDEAVESRGASVLIEGDAGVGKSRLFNALIDELGDQNINRYSLYCEPYNQNTPYYALTRFLHRVCGLSPEDASETKRLQLSEFVDQTSDNPQEILPFLANMLDLNDAAAEPRLAGLSPQRLKEETVAAVITLIRESAGSAPVLMFVDDLHWSDPSTLQFLSTLSEGISDSRVLLVMTTRPDAMLHWQSNKSLVNINLSRLEDDHILDIIDRISGNFDLPADVRKQILDKSDGIPLYAEELTKSVIEEIKEQPAGQLTEFRYQDLSVPNALANSLMARLDRLHDVKDFALLCSVIGRDFSIDMVSVVSGRDDQGTDLALNKLVAAEIIQSIPNRNPAAYVFRHALLREAAYNNLLRSQRKSIHQRIAETLEAQYPQTVINEPERLAHHHTGAESYIPAIQYWLKAGSRALQGGANLEASEHLRRGIELLDRVEDEPLRLQLELPLQMTLAPALIALQGFAAPEVETRFSRARALCELMGSSEQLFPVLRGLMAFYIVRSEFSTALDIGNELQRVLEHTAHVGHRIELAWNLGSAKLWHGRVREAMEHFEEGMPLYDKEQHAAHAFAYGQDPGVAALTHYALCLTLTGRYAQAVKVEQELLSLVEELNHPFTRAQSWAFVQTNLALRNDWEASDRFCDQSLAYCEAQRFPLWLAVALIGKGQGMAKSGDASGIELIEKGFRIYASSGAMASLPSYFCFFAVAHLACGDPDSGMDYIEKAFSHIREKQENLYLPWLYALKGSLLLRRDGASKYPEAEQLFRQSRQQAQTDGTRHLELIAALEFNRSVQALEFDAGNAVEMLRDVCAGFDPGDNSPLMIEARGFLQHAGS